MENDIGMAQRGPKPKAAALKVLTGNPGKRDIPAEPEFSTGELVPPKWLKGWGLEEWNRIVPELERLGLARNVSYSNLAGLCRLYHCAIKAMKSGNMVQERQAWEAYRKASNEFGLTPATAGRAGSAVNKPPAGSTNRFRNLG